MDALWMLAGYAAALMTTGLAVAVLRLLHPSNPRGSVGGDLVSRDELRREMQIFETHMEEWAEQLRHLYDRSRKRIEGTEGLKGNRDRDLLTKEEDLTPKERARRKARERGLASASLESQSQAKAPTIS